MADIPDYILTRTQKGYLVADQHHYLPSSLTPAQLKKAQAQLKLPASLTIGGGDADLQVVGQSPDSLLTAWTVFCRQRKLDTPQLGSGRYRHWPQFIDYLKSLGLTSYRTSVSMSRTLNSKGQVNLQTIKWYQKYFASLKQAGIKHLAVTLYHWELPQHLSRTGGWKNRSLVDFFVKHTQAVVQHLDEFIDEYYIFNEPWCASLLSYHLGIHAPGETDLLAGLAAAHHMLIAHGRVFQAIKKLNPQAKISTVFNVETAYPASSKPADIRAAQLADGYYNRWFLDPLFKGQYPQDMLKLYRQIGLKLNFIKPQDSQLMAIGRHLSSLGLNYYRSAFVQAVDHWQGTNPPYQYAHLPEPTNSLNWPIHPEGLRAILQQVWQNYTPYGLKNIQITENGMAHPAAVNDYPRFLFIREHLRQISLAIADGINISHYFFWTLVDNFEWAEGYRPQAKFGLAAVNPQTGQITPKRSARLIKKLIRTHTLPAI